MLRGILWLCCISCALCGRFLVMAEGLPTAVQLGSAIVAAVEDDVEQEEEQMQQDLQEQWWWRKLCEDVDLPKWENLLVDVEEGRGRFKKKNKMMKYMMPIIMGVLVAKSVLIPLLLKMITALSTSSFVMSKIALIISGLLAAKWIFSTDDGGKERSHLEIIQLPLKTAHAGGGGWGDLALSGSNLDVKTKKQLQKYIPVGGEDEPTGNYQHSYNSAHYDRSPFL